MGCKVSKSGAEPCASSILGCNKFSRSYSSPIQLADVQHSLQNSKCESFHVVSLISSTYGSLELGFVPHLEEERNRADTGSLEHESFESIKNDKGLQGASYSWSHESDPRMIASCRKAKIEGEKSQDDANYTWEQFAISGELTESLKYVGAHREVGLMENSRVFGLDSGISPPRLSTTIHTIEELDSVLDVRRSFPINHCSRRGPLMEPVIPICDSHKLELESKKMHGTPFPMQPEQLPLGMISQKSKEFDSIRKSGFSRSQELEPTGRNNLFHRQGLDSMRRSNLTRSEDFDSIRRSNLSGDQGFDFTRSYLSQSQEFVRPSLAMTQEAVALRQSLFEDVSTGVCIGDYGRKIATSQPDPVLRSPMLKSLSGYERLRVCTGQQSPMSRLASPKLSGVNQTSFSLDEGPNIPVSPKRSAAKAVTPGIINASRRAAEFSLLRNRNSKDTSAHAAMPPAMSKYLMSRAIDDSQDVNTTVSYSVSNTPPYGFVAIDDKTNFIVPNESTQDEAKIFTVKQSGWTTSASKESTSSTTSSSTSTSASQKIRFQGRRESVMDDSISSVYELIPSAEVLEEDLRPSGLLITEQPSQTATVLPSDINSGKSTIWSLDLDRSNSLPLDPEFLASFEEALELFCADDWCTVRLGECDAAVTSGSISESDSSSWQRETRDPCSNRAGEPKINKYKILEDHVEKPLFQPGILRKVASSKIVPLEIQEQKMTVEPLQKFEEKCPPGGEERCVLYTTSLRGIRKTFEDCTRTRAILQSSDVLIDERDIAMHAEFRQEMTSLAGKSAPVPRLFIKGRYIGGGEEVSQLHEEGTLGMLLEGLPRQLSQTVCDGCGGVRFIPCSTCSGSCKVITQEGAVACCRVCNENGLSRCPVCL